MSQPEGDRRLARNLARVIAVQTGAAVAVVLVLVGVAIYFAQERSLHLATERTVRTAAQMADDLDDISTGVVLFEQRSPGAGVDLSGGAPAAFSSLDVAALPLGATERRIGDRRYELYTALKGDRRLGAALDLRRRTDETERLLGSLAVAGLIGAVGAAGVGAVVGRRAIRPATLALELQRRFVADASHELRTPLTIVHTRAQLLRSRLRDADPAVVAEVDQLVSDTRGLGEVVQDLLLSAELGARPSSGVDVDFGSLVGEVVSSFAQLAEQRSVSLVADLGDGPLLVSGVAPALRRALGALVDNALGHVPEGGRVRVAIERRGDLIVLTVTDTGDGFDSASGADLLGRFARGTADSDRRRFGLGLALVHEVVLAHRGRLVLGGAPGAGAEITVELPAVQSS